MQATGASTSAPSDALTERLNDPVVAAALVTLLDHAELLSTLVLGLGELLERGDTIMGAVADGVHELQQAAAAQGGGAPLPKLSDLATVTGTLVDSAPTLDRILHSSMVDPASIALLSLLADAATEGAARARENHTRVAGLRAGLRTLKDPEVQTGLGFFVEIAAALGRRVGHP